jgi:hypothetical protein
MNPVWVHRIHAKASGAHANGLDTTRRIFVSTLSLVNAGTGSQAHQDHDAERTDSN